MIGIILSDPDTILFATLDKPVYTIVGEYEKLEFELSTITVSLFIHGISVSQ